MAGHSIPIRKTATRRGPNALKNPRSLSGNILRKRVSRRCSFLSIAMTAPSMASQRKQKAAASSTQTMGREST
jgi:hypothetical protein